MRHERGCRHAFDSIRDDVAFGGMQIAAARVYSPTRTQWRDSRQLFPPNCPRSWEIPSGRPPWTDPLRFYLPAASNTLTRHKLLLHQQVILHAILLQKPKLALGGRRDHGQANGCFGSLLLLLLLVDANQRCRRLVLLLLLIISIAFLIPCTSLLARQPARLSLTPCSSSSCSVCLLCSNFQ